MTKHHVNRIRPRKPIGPWARLIARSHAGGQALIEYVLIIVLVTIAIIAVLAITGPAVGNVFSNTVYNLLGGTVQPRDTLSADEFWEQVAAVASYTPESPSLITNTPAPATAAPTAKPTDEPSAVPPTAIPTDVPTAGPSPTPPDQDFGYPFDDPGNNPDWWEHNFGGPFDNLEWNAEYWDLSRRDGASYTNDMEDKDPETGKYRETVDSISMNWGNSGPGGNVQKNFYARFTTTATFEDKAYTLRVRKDDGVRVWINDQLVVDQWSWSPQYDTSFDTIYDPSAAGAFVVKVEFFDNGGGALLYVNLINTEGDQGDCNWKISNEEFHSAPNSWTDSPGKDYSAGSYCTLLLRGFIDLRTATRPMLEFWDRYALSSNTKAWVGIAVYNSDDWVDVEVHSNETNLGWTRQTFDLTNFGTETPRDFRNNFIEIRFILDAKNETTGAGGWWLDDIQVEQEIIRRYTVGFSDDMEGASHWYPGGTWALSNEEMHKGGKAWSDSPGQDYQSGSDTYLELDGLIDMTDPTVIDPEMVFWHRYNLVDSDKISAEISTDRKTWTTLKALADSESNLSWTQQVVSLGGHIGEEFYFRFRLDATLNGAVADGWWIDDFSLRNRTTTSITLDWCDNMEGSTTNWQPDGKWGLNSGPDVNNDSENSGQTVNGHSGSQFWSDSPRADYDHSTSSSLQLIPLIDLNGAQNPELVFWHQWDLADSDDLHVEISENNGEDWTSIWTYQYGGLPYQYRNVTNTDFDSVLSWTRESVSLKQAANKTINIRFRLDALISSAVDDGWWVDDVCFQEYNQPVRSLPVTDGFERGSGNWIEGGTWTIAPEANHTGAVGYTDSNNVRYKSETNAILELRGAIDLRGSVKPTLYFWDVFELASVDYSLVEINTSDDGITWAGWDTVYTHKQDTTVSWDRRAVDLRSYKSKLIRVRFRLYGDPETNVGQGWGIDDFSVIERQGAEQLHSLPFFEDAETSSSKWVQDGTWSRMPTQRGIGSGRELGPGGWTGAYWASDPAKCSTPTINNSGKLNATVNNGTLIETRTDEEIAFDFDGNIPFGMRDCFTVIWTRAIYVPNDNTTYEIQTHSDDGIRLFVDLNVVGAPTANITRQINKWVDRGYNQTPDKATVTLSQGFHTVIVEYFENGGGADVDVDFTLQGMVYHDSPSGTYFEYDDASLTLEGLIDLSGTTHPALTYWEKRSLGSSHAIYTQISTDEGFSWRDLKVKTGTDNTWRKQLIDLTAYAGQKVNIRFRLDARAYKDPSDGWYIDDILVAE